MGNPIEPTDPEWQGCVACKGQLPLKLNVKITTILAVEYIGEISQTFAGSGNYAGYVEHNGDFYQVYIAFCYGGFGSARCCVYEPGHGCCNLSDSYHCFTSFTGFCLGDTWEVWPSE